MKCFNLTLFSRAFSVVALMIGGLFLAPVTHAEKVLRYANDGDIGTLDPQLASLLVEGRILTEVFQTLVAKGPDGTKEAGAAQSWTISSDGLVYTLALRPHTWSDGVPVTADDYVFSYRRLVSPETAAQYASLYYVIKNAAAIGSGTAAPETLGVRALDPVTLEITLEYPTPYFLDILAHLSSVAVPKHVIETEGKKWARAGTLIGNGPFVLTAYTPNDKAVLAKNPRFYDADNVRLDGVVFYAIDDFNEHVKRFRAGEVEITGRFAPDQYEWLKKNLPDNTQAEPWMATEVYMFNTSKEPFNDIRVRQALSMVIDRETLSGKVIRSGEVPAYGVVPPGLEGYGASLEPEWKDWPMDRRVAEAQSLLAEAGYGPDRPLAFELRYNTGEEQKRRAVAVVAMWKKALGVEVALFNNEGKIHYADLRSGNFQVARFGWVADYADPHNFLYLYQTSTGAINYTRYSNPEFDALMTETNRTMDATRRAALLHQAETVLVHDAPVIPLSYEVSRHLVSQKVQGWVPNVADSHPLRWVDLVE